MPASWTSVAVALTPLIVPMNALAQRAAADVALHYDVEPSLRNCPSRAVLRADIARQLGYEPFTDPPSSANFDVHIKISRDEPGLRARIDWSDEAHTPRGERRLEAEDDDCAELARGVVFAVAVQLQLRDFEQPPPPSLEPKPAPPPTAKLPATTPAMPAPTAELAVLMGVGALARAGSQPGVAAALRAFASLRGRAWAVSADAYATMPTTAQAPEGASISAQELGAGAASCLRHRVFDACALGTLMLVSVRGQGVDHVRHPRSVGLGVGLRLELVQPWRETLAALAHVDVLVQPIRHDVLLNHEIVWSSAPLVIAVGFDVAAIFR